MGVEDVGSDKLFQKKKIRKEKDLARRQANKSPYETIVIVCEDTKSTPNYFKELIKELRLNTANVIIIPGKGSAPISVVEHGIEMAKTRDSIDRITCVMDHDNHESLKRAINKLKTHTPKYKDKSKPLYQAIVSTPCFEIWLLLHFIYTTKSYIASEKKSAADFVISDLIKKLPLYSKNISNWFNHLVDKQQVAIKYAKKLQEYNVKTKSTNPATNMHELVEYLINLKDKI